MSSVRKSKTHHNNQSAQLLLDLLSNKWAVLVIYALQHDTKRYSELGKDVAGITEKVLTDTLKKLERDGMVTRSMYPVIPPRVEYTLTPLGLELFDLAKTITEWSVAHEGEIGCAQRAYDRRKR